MNTFISTHDIGLLEIEAAGLYPWYFMLYSQVPFSQQVNVSYNSLKTAKLELSGFLGWAVGVHESGLTLTSQDCSNVPVEYPIFLNGQKIIVVWSFGYYLANHLYGVIGYKVWYK